MFPHIGWVELTLVLVLVTMLFGIGKLPEVFGAVGKGIRELRKESSMADGKPLSTVQTEQTAETRREN
jgi:sec-independent protein translocase protein TatA